LYHGNPGRESYSNSGGGPPNRANYGHRDNRGRHEPRSVAPVQKLSYNKDGSIKWANKVADTSDQQQDQGQQQQQQDQGQQDYGQYDGQDQQQQSSQSQGQNKGYYESNDNYYGNKGSNGNSRNSGKSSNNNYYGGSNNQQQSQQNDYYDSYDSYSGGNQKNNYYQEDQSDQYYGQGNDNQNDYYGGQANGNNDYGYSNNNNYGGNNNNYGYENRNSNNNINNNNNNNNNNQNQNSNNNQDNATKSKQNVTAGFAGGIRLAGAFPDDGYSRGEGTFYDLETRVGSCGKQNKNSEFVVALNTEQMGEDGRNNPNCGKDIEVIGPSGKSVQVTVVDSCKTCKSGGLDLSPAAYEEIGDFSHGSVPIKWKFV
jgi:hypothetical protein